MAECRIDQFDIEAALAYAIAFLRDLGRQWFDLRPETRPRFQKLLFPDGIPYTRNKPPHQKFWCGGKGFGTAKLGLIYEINRRSGGDLSQVVDQARIELATSRCHRLVLPLNYRPFSFLICLVFLLNT